MITKDDLTNLKEMNLNDKDDSKLSGHNVRYKY
jgi:hypothetical protein